MSGDGRGGWSGQGGQGGRSGQGSRGGRIGQGGQAGKGGPGTKGGAPGMARPASSASRDGGESRLAKLRIMAKEVTIACRPGEEDALEQAAAYIDRAMRELRSRNSTSSIEKIAIVTAINTADALLKERADAEPGDAQPPAVPTDALDRVASMNARIDALLDTHGLGDDKAPPGPGPDRAALAMPPVAHGVPGDGAA